MKTRIERITLDIDKIKLFSMLRGVFVLWIYGFRNIEIRESPSKRGIHIIGWHNKGYSQKKIYRIRFLCGDDLNRLRLDKCSKKREKQILFSKKEVKYFKNGR